MALHGASPPGAEFLTVCYVDDDLLVLDKPAGLLSVPGRGEDKQDCLSRRAQTHYPDALIVHRLDMATSGLILMARGVANQRLLSKAFAEREVHKRYIAVLDGLVPQEPDCVRMIDLPIGVDWPNRPRRVIDLANGKASLTRLRVLSHHPEQHSTRVELEPLTGRSHQLRLHMLAIGHPILGDTLYAGTQVQARCARLALHARTLTLRHPASGQPLTLQSSPEF